MKRARKICLWLLTLYVAALLAAGCRAAQEAGGTPESQTEAQTEAIVPATEENQRGQWDSDIRIALIDTGIAADSISSAHVLQGWNYCTDSDDTADTIGHGTSLAGLILGSEAAGLPGGAPDAYVVPLVCQRMDADGNVQKVEPEGIAQMLRDAIDIYNCRIINISAGVKQDYAKLREAVAYAAEQGALVVSCAGNEGNHEIYYPGGYASVLCVGSADSSMTGRAAFSQDNDTVDLLAPGEKLAVVTMKGNVMEASGTSYSAAYISAVAAQLWMNAPTAAPDEIVEMLFQHTVCIGQERILSME